MRPEILMFLVMTMVAALSGTACRRNADSAQDVVVVYAAVDQHQAQPIFRAFERESGIRVAALYDTEASKTTGLVTRLLAERYNPRADVFWSNEVIQTIGLKGRGVLAQYVPAGAGATPDKYRDPTGYWTGVGARARVIVYNTDKVSAKSIPYSLEDLIRPEFRGRVAVAYPLFGTTFSHASAMFASWGEPRATAFFSALVANETRFVDGNATVRNLVAGGEVWLGLTDTDDVHVGMIRGLPISMVLPDQDGDGTLILPTSVSIIAECPHPEAAQKLADFLVSDRVEALLAASPSAYLPLRPGVGGPDDLPPIDRIRVMNVDFETIAEVTPRSGQWLRQHIKR